MKVLLKLSVLWLLAIALAGCAAQKPGSKAGKNSAQEVLHQQALKALKEQNFKIEVTGFYLSGDRSSVKSATSSYITMQGSRAIIKFAPDLSAHPPFDYENIEDNDAKITKIKDKKNGDTQYCIIIKGPENFQNRKIVITLYKDTNQCFAQVSNEILSYHVVDFTGHIYPMAKE